MIASATNRTFSHRLPSHKFVDFFYIYAIAINDVTVIRLHRSTS